MSDDIPIYREDVAIDPNTAILGVPDDRGDRQPIAQGILRGAGAPTNPAPGVGILYIDAVNAVLYLSASDLTWSVAIGVG